VALHDGLTQDGSEIPRHGLRNGTLQSALGRAIEPYGTVEQLEGRAFVAGKVSHFGGPNDGGVSSTETGAISGERLRSLNSPLNPSAATLAARPADYYYGAMRFNYSPNGRASWEGVRLLVVNPADGRAVVVRPVDWGPHTRTARIIDLSPQAVRDLGVDTDDEVYVSFAIANAPLGVVVMVPPSSEAIVIDNSDPTRFRASNGWLTSDFATGRVGADYRYRSPELTSDPAEYRAPIAAAGSYELFARIPGRGYNSNVPYLIRTTAGMVVVRRNTTESPATWISLGTHPLAEGDDWIVQISCWTSAAGYVVADAIRIEGPR
jgi:hypothetical protein